MKKGRWVDELDERIETQVSVRCANLLVVDTVHVTSIVVDVDY